MKSFLSSLINCFFTAILSFIVLVFLVWLYNFSLDNIVISYTIMDINSYSEEKESVPVIINHPVNSDTSSQPIKITTIIHDKNNEVISENTTLIDRQEYLQQVNTSEPETLAESILENEYQKDESSIEQSDEIKTSTNLEESSTIKPVVEIAVKGSPLTDNIAHEFAIENYEKYADKAIAVSDLVNTYRIENGLNPYDIDYIFSIMAMHRAVEAAWVDCMIVTTIDGHTRHIRPNGKIASSIREYYGVTQPYGENIGRYQRTPEEIFEGWKNSPAQKSLMLSKEAIKCGIGVAQDSAGYYYWVLSVGY